MRGWAGRSTAQWRVRAAAQRSPLATLGRAGRCQATRRRSVPYRLETTRACRVLRRHGCILRSRGLSFGRTASSNTVPVHLSTRYCLPSWKAAARSYLDAGGSFVADSLAAGVLSRPGLDGVDGAKAALEAADRAYNAALDALEVGQGGLRVVVVVVVVVGGGRKQFGSGEQGQET